MKPLSILLLATLSLAACSSRNGKETQPVAARIDSAQSHLDESGRHLDASAKAVSSTQQNLKREAILQAEIQADLDKAISDTGADEQP